jgi:L-amino acid N-acyltransferase YncA
MSCTVRLARRSDLTSINDIYNYYVDHSTSTYQETPEPFDSRQAWFDRHGPQHPVTVAEVTGRWLAGDPSRRTARGQRIVIRLRTRCTSTAHSIGGVLAMPS